MDLLLLILIIIAVVKIVVLGFVAWKYLWPQWRGPAPKTVAPPAIKCIYCHAAPVMMLGEERRWEGDELVLVTTYECNRCRLPFWHLERISVVEHKQS
jgi:hypothetical protein